MPLILSRSALFVHFSTVTTTATPYLISQKKRSLSLLPLNLFSKPATQKSSKLSSVLNSCIHLGRFIDRRGVFVTQKPLRVLQQQLLLRYHCCYSTALATMSGYKNTNSCIKQDDHCSKNNNSNNHNAIPDIEDLHRQAVLCKSNTYIDPSTGFTVFTEYAHLKRGTCCGNKCRHCPYGWENVDLVKKNRDKSGKEENDQDATSSFVPKRVVKSGERQDITELLDRIHQGTYFTHDNNKIEYQRRTWALENNSVKKTVLDSLPSLGYTVASMATSCSSSSSSCSSSSSDTASNSSDCSCTNSTIDDISLEQQERQRYTSKNVPYTRTGDLGMSVLLNGERRSKDDEAFESMGTVDELCSVVGVVHAELDHMREQNKNALQTISKEIIDLQSQLLEIMCHLFDIGSHLAKPRRKVEKQKNDCKDSQDQVSNNVSSSSLSFEADGIGNGFHKEHIDILERWIDGMTDQMPELLNFILPTGSRASSQLHVARCVCRRAERRVQPLVRDGVCDPNAAKYLNRLSDYLFTAARYCNFVEGRDEVQYKRPTRGMKQRSRVTVELSDNRENKNE
jgi:cob(I)alamin adenosyltransferase